MRARSRLHWACATWLIAWAACGGDDEDGDSLSGDLVLSELTDAQARAWCRSLEEQERSRLLGEEEFCRQAAVYFATTPEQCEERFALCRTEQYPSYREQQLASWECGTASRSDIVPGACEATLAEYEACFESTWEARKSFAANVSCEDPADFGSAPEVTAECSSLLARCPGLAAGAAD